jgi:hypothetical protein
MKVVLLKTLKDSFKTSLWAEAIVRSFAPEGGTCVRIQHGVTDEAEVGRLVDSAMVPSGLLIVETDGDDMPIEGLVPDFTVTVERHAHWLDDVGQSALRARLEARLPNLDRIDNESIITDCLAFDPREWNADQQQRLDSALTKLGWSCRQTPENRLEWSRNAEVQVLTDESA